MKTAVVIPTLNEERYIGNILSDLTNQTQKPSEIVVVDGGSVDQTTKIIRSYHGVKLVTGIKPQGRQRNQGVTYTKSDLLLFVDADTRLPADFIEKSVQEMEQKNLDIAIPEYYPYQDNKDRYIKFFSHCINGFMAFAKNINPLGAAACLIVKRSVFEKTPGFHEHYAIDDVPLVREAIKYGTYGILSTHAFGSDRRFKKYGVAKMSAKYTIMGILYLFNQYELVDKINYHYGEYHTS